MCLHFRIFLGFGIILDINDQIFLGVSDNLGLLVDCEMFSLELSGEKSN